MGDRRLAVFLAEGMVCSILGYGKGRILPAGGYGVGYGMGVCRSGRAGVCRPYSISPGYPVYIPVY